MHQKWVVVMNRSLMKVFLEKNQHLMHLKTLHNKAMNYSNSELGRHYPGTISEGSSKNTMSASSPRELAVEAFARKIAKFLDNSRKRNLVSHVVIISEPRLMGLVRKHFSRPDFEMTTQWIAKDLAAAPTRYLEDVVEREARLSG